MDKPSASGSFSGIDDSVVMSQSAIKRDLQGIVAVAYTCRVYSAHFDRIFCLIRYQDLKVTKRCSHQLRSGPPLQAI